MTQIKTLRSLLTEDGELRVFLKDADMPVPGDDEVVVEVEATPINPSDLGALVGPANLAEAKNDADGTLVAPVDPRFMRMAGARIGKPLPVGNEGAGVVVAAGKSDAAQALMGKRVTCMGGAMYATHRTVHTAMTFALPDDASARDGASCFVNPLTALSFVDTMRLDGHKGIIHTAAASNLGQMLNRICLDEDVALVNIVRKQEQVDLLKAQGAKIVVNSSDDDFMDQLTDAIAETNASLGFDATGGGNLADRMLTAMERAFSRDADNWSPYGSTVYKQVYLYGGLNLNPTTLNRGYGMSWGIGGYLLTLFMQRVGMERMMELQARVGAELKTTFASNYSHEISLSGVLDADTARAYNLKATGEKYLINPTLG
ncbi:MAG: zinc-binding dehydrogenase [Alphaproteobacteria bacterium]